MTGERRIAAPRQAVWDGLNDAAVLKASIPGCESLEKTSDTQMKAVAAVKLGPISARFNGAVTLSDIDAPNSYTIIGEGQGGVAGFAKGGAKVFLADEDGGATLLKYAVHEEPFLHEAVPEAAAPVPPAAAAAPAYPQAAPPSAVSMRDLVPREPFGLPVAAWAGIAVFAVMVLLWAASIF